MNKYYLQLKSVVQVKQQKRTGTLIRQVKSAHAPKCNFLYVEQEQEIFLLKGIFNDNRFTFCSVS